MLTLAATISACTYNERVKDITGLATTPYVGSSSLSVTLVNSGTTIENPSFSHGAATLKYNIEDSVLNGVRAILDKSYARVDVSSSPIKSNELYATIKVDVEAPSSAIKNDVTRGLYSTAALEIFESSTGKKLASYYSSNSSDYYRPGALNGYLLVTMLSGFALTPITMPLAVDVAGKYVSTIIDDNLRSLLRDLEYKIHEGEIINHLQGNIQTGSPVNERSHGGGIESLLSK